MAKILSRIMIGVADVIALRPLNDLFEVKFIQVKTSQNIKEKKVVVKEHQVTETLILQVEWWYFPVKNDHYWQKFRERVEKAK